MVDCVLGRIVCRDDSLWRLGRSLAELAEFGQLLQAGLVQAEPAEGVYDLLLGQVADFSLELADRDRLVGYVDRVIGFWLVHATDSTAARPGPQLNSYDFDVNSYCIRRKYMETTGIEPATSALQRHAEIANPCKTSGFLPNVVDK